ncbi:MAG: TetR/AcrR family transcriptional regulator [Rhodospirillaceae bacterium]|nr:TetR/AcrR family transcriptional regulator [Rhodospirillaceae bacterium]
MARKAKQETHPEDLLIDAGMALAAEGGWRGLSIATVAAKAEVALPQALRIYPSKIRILTGLARRIDTVVLEDTSARLDDAETPRDRLFDVLMRRFDALQPYKPGLRNIIRDLPGELPRDPLATACQLGNILGSMHLTLEIAGIPTAGIVGGIKAKVLAAIYANALRVWLDDDSPDLAPTMAVLDRGLMQAEKLATVFSTATDEAMPFADK